MMSHNAITDVPGITVGHDSDLEGFTGCTVILCESGAVGGVDVRGTASGTRQVDSLHPLHLVPQVHAICLAGGSAYGLDAAGGVMQFLEEKGVGLDFLVGKVPVVPTAILFDLFFGSAQARPRREMGYAACQKASGGRVEEGSVGAATGATVGKVFTVRQAMKGGIGTASARLPSGGVVGALAAVNAYGDVRDPRTGLILAGARTSPDSRELADTCAIFLQGREIDINPWQSTTLGVIATDVSLTKAEASKVAQMAQDGISRVIAPAHTPYDGDVVFALSVGSMSANVTTVGLLAAELLAEAIQKGVKSADGFGKIPAWKDLWDTKRENQP